VCGTFLLSETGKHAPVFLLKLSKKRGIEDAYFWTPTTVGYILEKREYMGHTVLGKTISLDYKTKKRRKAKENELIIFKNTTKPSLTKKHGTTLND
jgi:hypothetical protein